MSVTVFPGSVVVVRNEEWLVTSVEQGGNIIHVSGLSESVRDTQAYFNDAHDTITPLDATQALLRPDMSPGGGTSKHARTLTAKATLFWIVCGLLATMLTYLLASLITPFSDRLDFGYVWMKMVASEEIRAGFREPLLISFGLFMGLQTIPHLTKQLNANDSVEESGRQIALQTATTLFGFTIAVGAWMLTPLPGTRAPSAGGYYFLLPALSWLSLILVYCMPINVDARREDLARRKSSLLMVRHLRQATMTPARARRRPFLQRKLSDHWRIVARAVGSGWRDKFWTPRVMLRDVPSAVMPSLLLWAFMIGGTAWGYLQLHRGLTAAGPLLGLLTVASAEFVARIISVTMWEQRIGYSDSPSVAVVISLTLPLVVSFAVFGWAAIASGRWVIGGIAAGLTLIYFWYFVYFRTDLRARNRQSPSAARDAYLAAAELKLVKSIAVSEALFTHRAGT